MSLKHKILLILSCVVISAFLTLLMGSDGTSARLFVPSTFSAGPGGCKALYLLMEELHVPVARLRKPFTGLSSGSSVLIVVEPWQVQLTPREISKLKQWVEEGNRLLIFEGGASPRPKEWTFFSAAESKITSVGKVQNSLARKLGLRAKRFPYSSRTTLEISSPRLFGVNTLSISNATRWGAPPKEWTVIAADSAGPAIVSKNLGKGEVWAVSDATMITNQSISLRQNVRLVPAVALERTRPDAVLFDEYHHGYGLADSFWTYAGSTLFAWIMIQALVGTVLFFYSRRARYSGRFRSLEIQSGRSTLEYIYCMAHIFDTSRAGPLALEAVLQRFLGRLGRKAGVPLKDLDRHSIEVIAARTGLGPDCAGVIEKCRRAVESHRESAETLELARRLAILGAQRM